MKLYKIGILAASLLWSEAVKSDDAMATAQSELNRSWTFLSSQTPPAHWIGLQLTKGKTLRIRAENGAAFSPKHDEFHLLDVDLRVGNLEMDSSRQLISDSGEEAGHFDSPLPLSGEKTALKQAIWMTIDDAYRSAVRRYIKVKSEAEINVELEDKSADWSEQAKSKHSDRGQVEMIPPKRIDFWNNEAKRVSKALRDDHDLIDSGVLFDFHVEKKTTLTTDGTEVQTLRAHHRAAVYAKAIAMDGMQIKVYDYLDARSENDLPFGERLDEMAAKAGRKAVALRNAPIIDPFVGPAILRGRAAAVFFHEILGHRLEGHRQKNEDEGKTLTDKIGKPIFPDFINVADDPTKSSLKGQDLNGYYRFDDEGSPAQAVNLVENGILRHFLTSRSPIENFPKSNGHGRREIGHAPVARQGNLIVSATRTRTYEQLRKDLIREIKHQNKPYGLIFDDISGGFTFTGRSTPNSYNVSPVTVWRVYPDGRKDELVRGVDMIGTPLITFGQILAASNRQAVFNGSCGAESGWVPVSAVAPDLLIRKVEVQRKEKGMSRPPILPAPRGTVQ